MHQFRNVVKYRNMGRRSNGDTLVYQVVHLTRTIVNTLGLRPTDRCRINGTIDNIASVSLACNPDPETKLQYIMISKQVLKTIKKEVGDEIEVRFEVEDANHVDNNIPEELQRALFHRTSNNKARQVWENLTPGKKRTWIMYVEKAKLHATKMKRVKEIIIRLKTNNLDPKVRISS